MNLYNTFLMNWAPYSREKTQIPNIDIKSSEYVFCCVVDAIRNKKPFCVVRMGDGEAGLMKYAKTGVKPAFANDIWFNKVGISKENSSDKALQTTGQKLIYAASKVDFLGSSIWGSSKSVQSWSIEEYINRPPEMPRCSNWYNMEWIADGCAHALVANFSFGILHNNPNTEQIMRTSLATDPRFGGKMAKSRQFVLINDSQINAAIDFIKSTSYDVYLVSGGPTFKAQMYEISRMYNKVILDIGAAMTRCWARSIN